MKIRRKIDLQPLVEYSSSSDSQDFVPPPPKHLHSHSSSSSLSDHSDQEDDELCMNEIEQRIRKLEKQLEGQVKRSANLGIHREQPTSHKMRNEYVQECQQCKSLMAENKRLKEELSSKKMPTAKAKPKEAREMQRIVKSGKLKLQKQMQLLQIVERLGKKLKASINKRRG